MRLNILTLLFLAIFGNVVNSADSDGKDFVFNFMQFENYIDEAITTNVIVIPLYKNSICTFNYTKQTNNQLTSIQKTAFYGKNNEVVFNPKEVILQTTQNSVTFNVNYANDFRIFASCTEEVKLIGRYSDPLSAMGDLFIIPSISNAGNKYIFSLATSSFDVKGFITLLPITQQNSITVNIAGYVNGAFYSNETIQYDTTVGQSQRYISILPLSQYDYNASIIISASSNVFVSYMIPWASSSNQNSDSCGRICYGDYITFMPMPVVFKQCDTKLSRPDQRIISNNFTTRLYVSPPDVPSDCKEVFTMDVSDKAGTVNHETINDSGSSTIELTDKSEMGSSTNEGQTPMYRFGSIINYPDASAIFGHFAHYVPSIEEWVTGKSQFYTLAKECSIELYTDEDGFNPGLIKVDGIALSKFQYTLSYMKYFNKKFGYFIVPITGYGLHTIENGGNYVMYVVCKNVNGINDAAGYLASGFNKRK